MAHLPGYVEAVAAEDVQQGHVGPGCEQFGGGGWRKAPTTVIRWEWVGKSMVSKDSQSRLSSTGTRRTGGGAWLGWLTMDGFTGASFRRLAGDILLATKCRDIYPLFHAIGPSIPWRLEKETREVRPREA